MLNQSMLTESCSSLPATRITVPDAPRIPQGYFRSKLFVSSSTTNPLVAAASPLLSLLERLCLSPTLPEISCVRENIEHELYAFHSRLASQQYASEFIAIANYLLSATIDELLGKNYLRLYNQPAEFKAFTPASHDNAEPQSRFFEIVNIIKLRINQYLDILELAYYCLISGFEGDKHLRADGRQQLDNLIDELYQLIQEHRVNKPHRLFREQASVERKVTNHKPVVLVSLMTLSLLVFSYIGSNSLLEHKAKTLLLGHISQPG